MLKFLFKSWLLAEIFSSSVRQQEREYNRLVANHYKELNKQVKIFKKVIKEYSDDIQLVATCIAGFLTDDLYGYSSDDINYMLTCLYNQGFSDLVIKITELMVNKYGAEYI